MKRHASLIAFGFSLSAVCMAAAPDYPGAARGEKTPAVSTTGVKPAAPTVSESRPDPSLVAEVSRLVEASLEALRDRREHRHKSFLKESLAKLPEFPPARWHSGYVRFAGGWVHVDQVPYLTSDSPTLAKYEELREKADRKHYPKATTAQAGRDMLLSRKNTRHILDDKVSKFRTVTTRRQGRLSVDIPGTTTVHEQTRLLQQVDTYGRENVRLTNSAGYSPGYARAQESLARWCSQNGLPEEAKVHWAHVFSQEPTNREAGRAIGLVEHRGRFFSKEQVDRAQKLENDVARSLEKWQDKLAKLQREAASPDESRRQSAILELRAIDDPDAVFALEAVALWQAGVNGQRPEHVEAFDREVVALVGKFDMQSATKSLVRFAVLHRQERVRHAAADRLKSREPRTFVPILLAGLTMPIQYDVQVVEDVRGQKQVLAGARQEHDTHIAGLRDTREVVNGWHLKSLAAAAMARMKEVQEFNLKADQLNRRIVAALLRSVTIDAEGPFTDLAVATEYDSPNPKRWWDWWRDYNEQYVSGEKPFYGYEYDFSTWKTYDQDYQQSSDSRTQDDWYLRCISCFAKGTPVWTLSGPKPIEDVKIGDRVLAQHPQSGELTYKGVLVTTVRPPSEMLTIRAGKSTITTTLGHPFFVVGKGWRMAKELTETDWICAQGATLPIDTIEKAAPAEAHNLMVADFGTYFVGKGRVLVHDNSPIQPARLEMPGLVASR